MIKDINDFGICYDPVEDTLHVGGVKISKISKPENDMKQTHIKTASLGSISHGTLKTEDLLSAFLSEMEWQMGRNGEYFAAPENFGERDKMAGLIGDAQDCFNDEDEIAEDKQDEADELVNELQDALGAFAPPYCYFGTHEGDGSDFGFWPFTAEIEDLPCYEGTDEAKEAGETGDFRVVNDHGNVTVYSANGDEIIGIV